SRTTSGTRTASWSVRATAVSKTTRPPRFLTGERADAYDPVMRMLACVVLALSLGGCGDSGGSDMAPADMTVGGDMTLVSRCGHPGDTGNAKHIGQFCDD